MSATNETVEKNERLDMNYGTDMQPEDLWKNWVLRLHLSLKSTLSNEIINFKGKPVFN